MLKLQVAEISPRTSGEAADDLGQQGGRSVASKGSEDMAGPWSSRATGSNAAEETWRREENGSCNGGKYIHEASI